MVGVGVGIGVGVGVREESMSSIAEEKVIWGSSKWGAILVPCRVEKKVMISVTYLPTLPYLLECFAFSDGYKKHKRRHGWLESRRRTVEDTSRRFYFLQRCGNVVVSLLLMNILCFRHKDMVDGCMKEQSCVF